MFSGQLGVLGKMAGVAAGGAALGLLVKGLSSSVGAAKEAQVAQARLTQALNASGVSFKQHGAEIDAAIQKTSKLAALDDEDLSDAFAKLVRTTGDVTKATQGMSLAADIARARNISLEAATGIVEKAMIGQLRSLKAVGVAQGAITESTDAVKQKYQELAATTDGKLSPAMKRQELIDLEGAKAKDKQATATAAMQAAHEKFAGSAVAYGNTAAGAQQKLAVAFENLQEVIGAKVLPILTKLTLKLVDLIEWSEKNWPRFQAAMQPVFEAVTVLVKNMIDRLQAIATTFEGVIKVIRGIRDGEWGTVWAGVKQVAVGAVESIVLTMVALPAKILGALSAKAFSGLSQIGAWIKNAVLDGLRGLANAAVTMIENVINRALDMIGSAVDKANAAGDLINKVLPGNPVPKIPKPGHVGGDSTGNYRGARAAGGPVSAGARYMVGERGPEMFVPAVSGRIIPNDRLGITGVALHFGDIHISGVKDGAQAARQFISSLEASDWRAVWRRLEPESRRLASYASER